MHVREESGPGGGGEGHADARGEGGEDVRGAFEDGAGAGEAVEVGVDVGAGLGGELRSVGELFHIQAEGAGGGDATGGGVGLLDEVEVGEGGHLVAESGG